MPQLDEMWAAIKDRPDDWDQRRMFADWLEENGHDVLAAGQRWQAENKKHPQCKDSGINGAGVTYWAWGSDESSCSVCTVLPDEVLRYLHSTWFGWGGYLPKMGHKATALDAFRQAEEELAMALVQVATV